MPFSPIGDEAADDAIANPKNHIRVKTTVAYPFNDATNNAKPCVKRPLYLFRRSVMRRDGTSSNLS